jgi:lysophospholipid acyltransferase (LPLAT)-like uncharacterized protein
MLRKLKKIKKFPFFITAFFYCIIRIYSLLIFKRHGKNSDYVKFENFPLVTVTWHNRILFFPIMFNGGVRKMTAGVVSASRDGEYLSDILRFFHITPVRGSSRKKGMSALRDSINQIKLGKNVCFTPDGPRGPKYRMSQGPVVVASMTNVCVMPLTVNYSNYWELKTWDAFRIPKPFSTATLVLGEPVKIPPDLTENEIEKWRLFLEESLNKISQ